MSNPSTLDFTKLNPACAEVAGTISTKQSTTETREQFVRRIAHAVILEMLR